MIKKIAIKTITSQQSLPGILLLSNAKELLKTNLTK